MSRAWFATAWCSSSSGRLDSVLQDSSQVWARWMASPAGTNRATVSNRLKHSFPRVLELNTIRRFRKSILRRKSAMTIAQPSLTDSTFWRIVLHTFGIDSQRVWHTFRKWQLKALLMHSRSSLIILWTKRTINTCLKIAIPARHLLLPSSKKSKLLGKGHN